MPEKMEVRNITVSVPSDANVNSRFTVHESPAGERIVLLNDVSLTVASGMVHALIGPSGGGKSTLLSTLNRMREIESGVILLDSLDSRQMNVFELRQRVGLVFQKPVFFPGTVADNICYGPRIREGMRLDEQSLVANLLVMVGLERDLAPRDPATLSGGQQQRVALARTLANQPEVLLLDEPTAALDAVAGKILEDLVQSLCREKGLAVVWVTHDLDQAARVAGHVTLLQRGRVVEQGIAGEFFARPRTAAGQAFLGERQKLL